MNVPQPLGRRDNMVRQWISGTEGRILFRICSGFFGLESVHMRPCAARALDYRGHGKKGSVVTIKSGFTRLSLASERDFSQNRGSN